MSDASSGEVPQRGEVWWMNFSPTEGREQRGERLALVVSANRFNESPAGPVIVCPLTTTRRPGISWHVELQPGQGGLDRTGYVMCEQVRAASIRRLRRRGGPILDRKVLRIVEDRLRILMDL